MKNLVLATHNLLKYSKKKSPSTTPFTSLLFYIREHMYPMDISKNLLTHKNYGLNDYKCPLTEFAIILKK